jgi:hypothetical protein
MDSRHPVAVATAMRPAPVPTVVAAAEVAAITHPRPPVGAAAVVATDMAVREAEMAAIAASRARATPNVVVVPPVSWQLNSNRHMSLLRLELSLTRHFMM